MSKDYHDLYAAALALSVDSSANIIIASHLAYENRKDKEALEVITQAYGRSAKQMAKAVQFWPQYFAEGAAKDYEPSTYQALFNIASLPSIPRATAFEQWQATTMHLWEVIEMVNQLRPTRERAAEHDRLSRAIAVIAEYCKQKGIAVCLNAESTFDSVTMPRGRQFSE